MVLLVASASIASANLVVFHDDFTTETLDNSKWTVGTNLLGRSQLGLTPVLSGGAARLRFETFNPNRLTVDQPEFLGTEIKTVMEFSQNQLLEFEVQLKWNTSLENGLVVAFFTFGFDQATETSDEIDIEILSNFINTPVSSTSANVKLAIWDDFSEISPGAGQVTDMNTLVSNWNVLEFNTYKFRLLADRAEWYINDTLLYTATTIVPDDPMTLRLNFWAPRSTFSEAYSSDLQPAGSAGSNITYSYDVEYVTVTYVDDDGDSIADSWEQQHFGGTSGGPNEDTDGDGFSSLQEFENDTDPNVYQVLLASGWNLVSIARVPDDNSVGAVFASANIASTVWTWDDGALTVASELEPTRGYWVYNLGSSVAVPLAVTQ